MDKEDEYKRIMEIIDNSIVVEPDGEDDNLGQDLRLIAKELVAEENTFRFSATNKMVLFEDSLLGALGDVPDYDKKVKPRYNFIKSFRRHYHIGLSAVKSGQAERYKDIAGSIIGFQGSLQYREAGVPVMEDDKKKGIVDRLRRN